MADKVAQDLEYHAARAWAELELAGLSPDPAVSGAHLELARLHQARLLSMETTPSAVARAVGGLKSQ